MYRLLVTIAIIAVAYYLFKRYAGDMNLGQGVRHGGGSQKAYQKAFNLNPGEVVIKQSMGHVDPNSHVGKGKTVALAAAGVALKGIRVIQLALTDQNRFILSYLPHDPVIFDKNHLPKITDTGVMGRFAKMPGATQQEGRILQIESALIPEVLIPENADVFEVSVPQDFILEIQNWVKKNQS